MKCCFSTGKLLLSAKQESLVFSPYIDEGPFACIE